MGPMVGATTLASEIRGEPMAAPISTFSSENPILKSTKAHGHPGGHTGIGTRMSSGGINMAQAGEMY